MKVLRYEIKDLTPPAEILHAMQAQITAEREKRAVIATSEGRQPGADQPRDRCARSGDREVGRREAGRDQQRAGRGGGASSRARRRTAKAIRQIADAIEAPGGLQAVNLRIAEQYIDEFGKLAKTNNTMIVPTNVADIAGHDRDGDERREGARRRRRGEPVARCEIARTASSSSPAARRGWAPRRCACSSSGGGRVVVADLKEDEGRALAAELGSERPLRAHRRHRRGEREGGRRRGRRRLRRVAGPRQLRRASCTARRSSARTGRMRSRHSRAR